MRFRKPSIDSKATFIFNDSVMDPYYIQNSVSIGHTSVGLRLIQNETNISSVFRCLATTRLRVFRTLIRLEKKLFPSARRNILLTWPPAIFSVKITCSVRRVSPTGNCIYGCWANWNHGECWAEAFLPGCL